MLIVIQEKWWMWIVRGLFSILLGGVLLLWPVRTVEILIVFLGIFLFLDGFISGLVAFTRRGSAANWSWYLLEGVLGVAIGLMAVFQPQWILYTALFIIALWAIGSGIIRILGGIQLRKEIAGEWMMIASGVLSALVGLLILLLPDPALLTVLWIIAIVLFMNGGVLIGFGIQLKRRRGNAVAVENS